MPGTVLKLPKEISMSNRTFSLIGGIAAVALAVSACAETPTQRSSGQAVDDSTLAMKAKAALIENKDTKARDINVEVFKGDVQLNGFVATASEKASATTTVQRLAGVKTVRNNLEVQPERRSGGEAIDDAMITAKVKAALIGDSRTKAYQIEVNTNQGEVQLGGFVDSTGAKAAAAAVASSVSGVKTVSNDLQVK